MCVLIKDLSYTRPVFGVNFPPFVGKAYIDGCLAIIGMCDGFVVPYIVYNVMYLLFTNTDNITNTIQM